MTKILMVSQIVGGDYDSSSYIHVGDDAINFDKKSVLLTIGRKLNIGFSSQKDLFIILYDFKNMSYEIIHIGDNYAFTFGQQEQIRANRFVGKFNKSSLDSGLRCYLEGLAE